MHRHLLGPTRKIPRKRLIVSVTVIISDFASVLPQTGEQDTRQDEGGAVLDGCL